MGPSGDPEPVACGHDLCDDLRRQPLARSCGRRSRRCGRHCHARAALFPSRRNSETMTFKLALAQMLVNGGDKNGNLAHATRMIQQAAAAGADLVLLPEAMDLGWTHPSALSEAEPVPEGQTYRCLRRAAM